MLQQQLTLFIPGLLHGVDYWREPAFCRELELPVMELMLSRASARTLQGADQNSLMFQLVGGYDAAPAVAAVCRLADTGRADGYCLRADPVSVVPDRDRLTMLGNQGLDIRREEADQLVGEFNRLFAEDGLQLEAPVVDRWYMRMAQPVTISTTPLSQVIGRDIHKYLPQGEGAIRWHAMMNEVQMLFHSSSVNVARRARGAPEINTLWLWGEGELPPAGASDWRRLWANDVLSRGLARWAGIEQCSLPATGEEWLEQAEQGGAHLVVLDALAEAAQTGDLYRWREQLQGVEEYWLAPLQQALKSKRLHELTLVSERARFELTGAALGRWWRRRRSFIKFTG